MIDTMQEAISKGEDYFTYHFKIIPDDVVPNPTNPVAAKVVILTDGVNASGALWFTRALLDIPGNIQAGQSTACFDATGFLGKFFLTEDKKGDPTSGINIPMGVLVSPNEDLNEPLSPSLEYYYPGYLGETRSVKDWLEQKLQTISYSNSRDCCGWIKQLAETSIKVLAQFSLLCCGEDYSEILSDQSVEQKCQDSLGDKIASTPQFFNK